MVVASALVFAWFAVRWQLGDLLGELTPPNQPDVREVADEQGGQRGLAAAALSNESDLHVRQE